MIKDVKRVDYSKHFQKQLKKVPLEIRIAFKKRRQLFFEDQFHPQLNNHQLSGNYKGFRSINITGDWRAIYSEQGNTIIFELLGTQSQLYK